MMSSPIVNDIISRIEKSNPIHAKKLRKNLNSYDADYYSRAEKFFKQYIQLLSSVGRDLDYGIDCYLKMNADMLYEQVNFVHTGEYSCKSFQDAVEKVYSKPEVMESYMHGLVVSTFLFKQHYAMFSFFHEILMSYQETRGSYLEIGAGHGLFIAEAMEVFRSCRRFDVVDISESSIELAKKFIPADPRVCFYLTDIYDYAPTVQYEFITMGEVMEHVEDPLNLLRKVKTLLNPQGRLFITVPANSPVMDHIYLFRNAKEIQELISNAGFEICQEKGVYVEDVTAEKAERLKVTLIYGALLKIKN